MSDNELLTKLQELVKQERDLIAEVLRHLREVEERRLYLARGYPSMFAFCTQVLNYSEGEAHVRIQAMRLIRTLPAVEGKIERGELSLSVAALAQGCFRRQKLATEVQSEIVRELSDLSTRAAERHLAARFPQNKPREAESPLSATLTRISFAATTEQLAKFRRLKALFAHTNFDGRYDRLFETLADMALKELDTSVTEAPQVPARRTRYIPPRTRRFVMQRASEQCEFVDALTGKRCEGRHGLQIDHIVEFRNGGGNEVTNLRALCGAHNRGRNLKVG